MRTTITLEPDVAEKVRQAGRSGTQSQKQIINEALRRGLQAGRQKSKPKPYKIEPFDSPFRAGIDTAKLNQIVDEFEAEAHLNGKLQK